MSPCARVRLTPRSRLRVRQGVTYYDRSHRLETTAAPPQLLRLQALRTRPLQHPFLSSNLILPRRSRYRPPPKPPYHARKRPITHSKAARHPKLTRHCKASVRLMTFFSSALPAAVAASLPCSVKARSGS